MKNIIAFLILLGVFGLTAQSKAEIKKNKIKSQTTETTKVEEGKTILKKEVEIFDESGNVIERSIYLNNKLEEKDAFKFNKAGEKTEHTLFNKDGSIKKKLTFKYNSSGDKIEEISYDPSGVLTRKEVIEYNAFGEKKSEVVYNGKGELLEKTIYTFDSKGLKKDRLTYDSENRLIGKKIYTYTFK